MGKGPTLAYNEPFSHGMTLYLMNSARGLYFIPTSEATHEVEEIEFEVRGRIEKVWVIRRKGGLGEIDLQRYASTPQLACQRMIDEVHRDLDKAVRRHHEEIADCVGHLAEFLRETKDA